MQNGGVCKACGTPYRAGDLYCIGCGANLVAQNGAAGPRAPRGANHTVLVTDMPQAAAPQAAAPQAAAPQSATCPRCGQPVGAHDDFCMSCGTRLTRQGPAPAPGVPQGSGTVLVGGPAQAAGGKAVCPVCGAQVEPGDLFCIACGAPLGPAPAAKPQPAAPAGGVYHGTAAPGAGAPAEGMRLKDEAPITSRAQLMILTREEARSGCQKTIEIDGKGYLVEIPAGVTSTTILDLPGLGYFDTETGERGSVRLSFFID